MQSHGSAESFTLLLLEDSNVCPEANFDRGASYLPNQSPGAMLPGPFHELLPFVKLWWSVSDP